MSILTSNSIVNIEDYTDGLSEIIPVKIQEIIFEMEALEEEKKYYLLAITNCYRSGKIDEFGVYFWTLYAECRYYAVSRIKKQLRGWLDLYTRLPDAFVPVLKEPDYADDSERIAVAKKKPVEDYYPHTLRGHGSRLMGVCPFHEERTPSFVIYTEQNMYHCFGACGTGGDVIDYIRKLKGLDFAGALAFLS